jgi:PBP1b-binding outer membrane lipoprotein LpoB
MKKIFLFIGFLFLLSGCSAAYDAPVQSVQTYKEIPAIIETTNVPAPTENEQVSAVNSEIIETESPVVIESENILTPTENQEITKSEPIVVKTVEPMVLKEDNPDAKEVSADLSNDNYYTNVNGNEVHSPAYSNSVPVGATAICGDGTYSFSQNRRGTCSRHGGVSQWLN